MRCSIPTGQGAHPRRCQTSPDQGVLGRLHGGTRLPSCTCASGQLGVTSVMDS
jgi:hypothetical protein